jgi:hypothetical protein
MPSWNGEDVPAPLPRDVLPGPVPREGSAEWESAVERVLAAAEPRLPGPRRSVVHLEQRWPSVLGAWWRPAAVLAAAATAAVLLMRAEPAAPAPGTIPLGVVATQGDPAALFAGLGLDADPVLALIALGSPRRE